MNNFEAKTWLFFSLCCLYLLQPGKPESILEGTCTVETPPNFEEMFLQYCEKGLNYSRNTCNTAWDDFLSAFVDKLPEEVQQEDYNRYFNTLSFTISKDDCLFWSGTRDLAEILTMMDTSGLNMMTSHTIKAAKLINYFGFDLCWCSSPGNTGLDMGFCPKSTTVHFWAQFGVQMALQARGSVFYLVDGLRNPAYRRTSLFSCYELQTIDPREVTQLVVLNIQTEGETCGTASLKQLCDDAEERNITCNCFNIEGVAEDVAQRNDIVQRLVAKIREIQNRNPVEQSPDDKMNNNAISGAQYCQYSGIITYLLLLMSCIIILKLY